MVDRKKQRVLVLELVDCAGGISGLRKGLGQNLGPREEQQPDALTFAQTKETER